ncbi:MAG: hypothetical protein LAQ69_06355 [Acidobacteriia bacterium]|nr:hypothetical protein [Terriglobia bacterium]
MGGIQQAEEYIKATINKIGAKVGPVLEPVWGMAREAARYRDLTIPTVTLYVQEDIGVGDFLKKELDPIDSLSGQITGVYVPPSVKVGATVNVILYMHGDKVRIWNKTGTIRDYWSLPELPLRQGLSKSGQPFILVAPTLGQTAGAEFGNLGTNIDDHLDHVLAQLHKLGPPQFAPPKPPDIDQLIIAGHSGAFGPITSILSSIKKYKSKIKEIWGFDIMYRGTAGFFETVSVPVYAYFNDTEKHSRELATKRKPNIFVMEGVEFFRVRGREESRMVKHDNLMQKFWLDRCRRIGTNGTDPDDKKRMVHR